jgi:hypothetical protein
MDRINSRIAQIYGYAVCLICVIVILISTKTVIDAGFDYANPLSAGPVYGMFGPASSFDAYRVQARQQAVRGPDGRISAGADTSLSEADLRRMFERERAEQAASAKYRALRSLVSGIVFLILATAMFILHWRWIRRTNAEVPAG